MERGAAKKEAGTPGRSMRPRIGVGLRRASSVWLALGACWFGGPAQGAGLPNVLWITAEDINPHLGCYGDTNAVTPHLDRFARDGLRYRHVWSNAPVCAPARTAIITGVYPTSLGAEHMRSLVAVPEAFRLLPQLLRDRGYYCVNNNKEDYNVQTRARVWDDSSNRAHWRNRAPGQPFFAVFNLAITHESQIRARPHTLQHDPARVRLPAYHPDAPEIRQDWAQYHDKITEMDAQFARRLQELEDAGLAEDTIVFFYGDNGSGMPRSKRWPYDSGLHVPLLLRVPEKFRALAPEGYLPGGTSDRLIAFVDLAPTLLSLAGIAPPPWMQGQAFLGPFSTPAPKHAYGFRGRMDERFDLVRSIRNQRYVYIRNYRPDLVYGQHIGYMFQTPTTRVWKELYDQGKLEGPPTAFWERKPPEELYDLESDPDEVENLAGSPRHQRVLDELRRALREHALRIRDVGFLPEAEMHRRAAGTTVFEFAHDPQRYPLEPILEMADAATGLEPAVTARLRSGLTDPDSGVRYWAVLGHLIRGPDAVQAARSALRDRLADESPSVRIMTAWTLAAHGSADDLSPALATLAQLAPPDRNGLHVSLLALNAIDALGPKAVSLRATLATMPRQDPAADPRMAEDVPRLVDWILR